MQKQQGVAEINGTRLYFELAGSGYPLVFIHGFSFDTRVWDKQFDAFAEHCLVIRYDMRGFGRSQAPTESYMHTDDLKALLDYIEVDRADIVGHSLGGQVAIDFAVTFPNMIRALIPVDSALTGFPKSVSPGVKGSGMDVESGKQHWLKHRVFDSVREQPEHFARLQEIVSDYSGWHWFNNDPVRMPTPPAIERLETIQAPSLVVVGELDVQEFRQIADLLSRNIPRSQKIVLHGAGHMPSMEIPTEFNRYLSDFLYYVEHLDELTTQK